MKKKICSSRGLLDCYTI